MPKSAVTESTFLSHEIILRKIYLVRGKKVMLDRDLAHLYGVTTGNLNKAVSRNQERFPGDFMFQLSTEEFKSLVFQIGRPNRGGTQIRPKVFTDYGILMLSSVLRSQKAIEVNVQIMRTFTHLRKLASKNDHLKSRLEMLEKRFENHDVQLKSVFEAIKEILDVSRRTTKKEIGFHTIIKR